MVNQEYIQETIFRAHEREVGKHLAGIVLCGSVNSELSRSSDVDFVVVLKELSGAALRGAAAGRAEVGGMIDYSVSNTVISLDEVRMFPSDPIRMDGKAAQGLIEAANRPERVMGFGDTQITLPPTELVQDFSTHNFALLDLFIRKAVARADEPELSPAERRKVANVGLIALKMRLQYESPLLFSTVGDGDLFEKAHANEMLGTFLTFAREVKADPEEHDSEDVLDTVADFLTESRVYFAEHKKTTELPDKG